MMHRLLTISILLVLLVAGPVQLLAQDDDVQAKIEDAMSAGPPNIAQDATILDWEFDADGNFVVLREGTNAWSCLPSNPKPMCLDEVFIEWLYALMAGDSFTATNSGFAYMLQGGEAFSNADPFATEAAEDYWESSEPYVMVLPPTGADLAEVSTDIDNDIENPTFIMYPDTPYEHVMVPIEYTAPPQTSTLIPIVRISPVDAFVLAENESAMLLDARYTSSYETSHAAGAISLQPYEVGSRIEELPEDQVMISYCD